MEGWEFGVGAACHVTFSGGIHFKVIDRKATGINTSDATGRGQEGGEFGIMKNSSNH